MVLNRKLLSNLDLLRIICMSICHLSIPFCHFRKCKFKGESNLTFAVRIGCKKMVKLWSSKECIFQCDLTSVCPYQLSYQHPDINKYLRTLITSSEQIFPEMEQWYKRSNYTNSVYDPHVAHDEYKKEELENFFTESLLFEDTILSLRSSEMIELLHRAMTEFSNTMAKAGNMLI